MVDRIRREKAESDEAHGVPSHNPTPHNREDHDSLRKANEENEIEFAEREEAWWESDEALNRAIGTNGFFTGSFVEEQKELVECAHCGADVDKSGDFFHGNDLLYYHNVCAKEYPMLSGVPFFGGKAPSIPWPKEKFNGSDHYKTGSIEPVDLYRSAGMMRHFALCSIVKYCIRNRDLDKPIKESDLKKIIHYAELLRGDSR